MGSRRRTKGAMVLWNVQRQLKTGQTRGTKPRAPLGCTRNVCIFHAPKHCALSDPFTRKRPLPGRAKGARQRPACHARSCRTLSRVSCETLGLPSKWLLQDFLSDTLSGPLSRLPAGVSACRRWTRSSNDLRRAAIRAASPFWMMSTRVSRSRAPRFDLFLWLGTPGAFHSSADVAQSVRALLVGERLPGFRNLLSESISLSVTPARVASRVHEADLLSSCWLHGVPRLTYLSLQSCSFGFRQSTPPLRECI